jgi:hypothetical protein
MHAEAQCRKVFVEPSKKVAPEGRKDISQGGGAQRATPGSLFYHVLALLRSAGIIETLVPGVARSARSPLILPKSAQVIF